MTLGTIQRELRFPLAAGHRVILIIACSVDGLRWPQMLLQPAVVGQRSVSAGLVGATRCEDADVCNW